VTAPAPRSFRYAEADGVATITLDRPQQLNALTFEVYRELTDTFLALPARPAVRAVVITGEGRAFCTGGDVREIIGPLLGREPAELHEFTRMTCDLIRAMRALPAPIVAALNGTTAGAGAAIAVAADLRVAADTARIAFLFVKVGLAGADMGCAQLLPRLVGLGRATELLMTGAFVDAPEAHRIGLYNRVVADDELLAEARRWAERLAQGPSFGLEVTKRMLLREAAMDVESAMAAETEIQAACMQDPNFREAYEAFRGKRSPVFR
jgi:enoyl-CoA hydratase/carnithine racemase